MKTAGKWMAEELGVSDRRRHFVPRGARAWFDAEGHLMGYVAGCGAACIAADGRYLARMRECAACGRR
ncbi:hypothetical protein GCM10009754_52700 [Amycolatopsis minnesotensis]|uniref:Uncharacterized protein n=1 Tax=Amycolatopsis minnesotensis TaxID=337894 RepID=A0ABP5CZN6_9PSEU